MDPKAIPPAGRARLSPPERAGRGRFGQGFIDGPEAAGRPLGRARKLAAADLRLTLLRLLADRPSHGYELIRGLEDRSEGYYTPSPGMIYPALAHLERAGLVAGEAQGQRKCYRLTEAGATHLAARREAAEALLAQFRRVAERMQHLRRALAGADAATWDPLGWAVPPALGDPWWELRAAVAKAAPTTPQETARIAAILREACARVLGTSPG